MPFSIQKKLNQTDLPGWCQNHQIDLCILFGSSVSGRVHPNSDVDIAISSQSNDLAVIKVQLIGELTDIFQAEIDLIILHADMSPLLLYEIMIKGQPLFVSNREILIEKQIYAIKLYEDVPFLKKWQDLSHSVNLERLKNVTANYERKS